MQVIVPYCKRRSCDNYNPTITPCLNNPCLGCVWFSVGDRYTKQDSKPLFPQEGQVDDNRSSPLGCLTIQENVGSYMDTLGQLKLS